ncbi:penicillin-binding protein 1C, partial [Thermodesulfobacteriota bacterium]
PLGAAESWLALQAMLEVVRPDEESAWRDFASSRKIGWKTGTSYGLRDAWAVGVTPKYAVGVWVGNADGEGRPGLTGITAAAPVLFELFGLLDISGWFDRPEADLYEIDICAKSGFRAGPDCAASKKLFATRAGLQAQRCSFCRIVHCDSSLKWRVNSECERISDIRSVKRFVLTPAMEWYYKKKHADYHPLPPYREDCIATLSESGPASLSLIYPGKSGLIYVPIDLDGLRGRTVFEAAHRNAQIGVYWHLDEQYIGKTHEFHQMELAPEPGSHLLTLVDENGQSVERTFTVLSMAKTESVR